VGDEPTPFVTTLASLAEAQPDRPAITDHERSVTRAELERRTNRLARDLAARGVVEGDLVTIGLPNSVAFYEAAIALWKLGATPQQVSSRLPAVELDAIIELAAPRLLIGLEHRDVPSVPVGHEPDPALSDEPLPVVVSPSWKAPTSGGSTGRPKLIVATAKALTEGVVLAGMLCGQQADGVHLCTGPLYHNGPFVYATSALLLGNHVVIMPRFDAERTLQLVQEHRVDWLYTVPTMLQRIWKLPDDVRDSYDLSSLNRVFHVAAPCPPWLKEAWIRWLGPEKIVELYAGTEAQAATFLTGTEWLEHRGSVGRPVIGEMKIVGPDGQDLPPGEQGEVYMRPPAGTSTYRYVGAEAKGMGDGWESLGDIGWMDEDGYLYLGDRSADMVLVGGSNVYPAEVEAALDEHPAIASSCVIGLPDDDLGNRVHAIVQVAEGESVTDEELGTYLAERLVRYKLPRSYERVDTPLRDDAGKVRRSALRAERLGAATT
jgi:bile acid-coenzyme A ligase